MDTKESIISGALQLSDSERAEVIEVLSQSIQQPFFESPEVQAAWDDEIEQRLDKIDRGEAEWVDGEDVMRKLRGLTRGRAD